MPKFKLNNKTCYDFGPAGTPESSCFRVSSDTAQGALYSTIAKSFRLWLSPLHHWTLLPILGPHD